MGPSVLEFGATSSLCGHLQAAKMWRIQPKACQISEEPQAGYWRETKRKRNTANQYDIVRICSDAQGYDVTSLPKT